MQHSGRGHAYTSILGALFFGLGAGLFFANRSPELLAREKVDESLIKELKTFTDVIALVQENYVQDVEGKQLAQGAIKGMLSALDPHSAYLDPQYFDEMQSQTKGEFGGLGIEIAIKEGMVMVVAPMEGTPASRAGLKPGDVIVKVDGEYLRDLSLVDVVKKLRGPKDSVVVLHIMRKGLGSRLKEYRLTRDRIEIKSVHGRYLGGGYCYVRLSQFMETTADDLRNALRRLRSKAKNEGFNDGFRGLILDLRNNPGGLLTQAIKVADTFLRDGMVVSTRGRNASQEQKFYAHEEGTEPEYPLVVMINGGSASASEIVAGALKDHGRALIVGEKSFGKGSVQTVNPLKNGGAVQLTTALYYTPSGISIQARGVEPDIKFLSEEEKASNIDNGDADAEQVLTVSERDLPGAISNPADKEKSKSKQLKLDQKDEAEVVKSVDRLPLDAWLKVDKSVNRALEILKTVNVLGNKIVPGAK
jgi:carboxyl-terminal processing protease